MVARINTPSRLLSALYYNENKVTKGKAVCIHAVGFLRDVKELSFQQKVQGFERVNHRNERAKTKTLHISLNFDPSEKPAEKQLRQIAEAYLKGIGFEAQPCLVYQHNDAGHPHIHIVVTTIREDGTRINTHNIGRNQSDKTRREIENKFGLVKAETKKAGKQITLRPVNTSLQYGKTETRQAINQVVAVVTQNYLFSSLAELNAILQKYNVKVDRGTEDSRVFKHRGLNFRMLDANGKPIGVPIKASLLTGKPTLNRLEELFEKNRELKEKFKPSLRNTIDKAIAMHPKDLFELKKSLSKYNIEMVLRQSADGRIYGVTFVDQNNRTVFNGSDAGKAYSAAHLQNRLAVSVAKRTGATVQKTQVQEPSDKAHENIIPLLLQPEQEFNHTPRQFLEKKKRKKKHLGL